jgi:hypothetical protein
VRKGDLSARVNSVANDDAECSVPVEIAQEQARLFQCRRNQTSKLRTYLHRGLIIAELVRPTGPDQVRLFCPTC